MMLIKESFREDAPNAALLSHVQACPWKFILLRSPVELNNIKIYGMRLL